MRCGGSGGLDGAKAGGRVGGGAKINSGIQKIVDIEFLQF